jgi:hypothetical protein
VVARGTLLIAHECSGTRLLRSEMAASAGFPDQATAVSSGNTAASTALSKPSKRRALRNSLSGPRGKSPWKPSGRRLAMPAIGPQSSKAKRQIESPIDTEEIDLYDKLLRETDFARQQALMRLPALMVTDGP